VRTVLIHVNAQVPDSDPRTAKEIADLVEGAIEVGSDNPALSAVEVTVVLAEEV
jgi:hypothetical protein